MALTKAAPVSPVIAVARTPANIARAERLRTKAEPLTDAERRLLLAIFPRPDDTRWPSEIAIGERFRKDMQDLAPLARSLEKRGRPLQRIGINPAGELLFGERRLRAWLLSSLRDRPIPVDVFDVDSIIDAEWDENDPALRRDMRLSEAVALKAAIEARLKPAAAARRKAFAAAGEKGRAGDVAARFTGKSRRTLEKAEEIVKAAAAEPALFGKLAEDMDRSGRVDGPHKRLKNIKAAAAIRATPAPLPGNGPYLAAVIDIPWAAEPDDDDPARAARGYYPYPTMATAQAAAWCGDNIAPRLAADATIALWITNYHLALGHQLPILAALGAAPVTILTGEKDAIGRGQVARGATEHVVIARRGRPTILGFPSTRFAFPVDRKHHSRKPQLFYDLFARAVPAPRYASFFETTPRGDTWDCHGNAMEAAPGSPAAAPSENLLAAAGAVEDIDGALTPVEEFSEDELRRQLLMLDTVQREAALPRIFSDMRALLDRRRWIAGKRKLSLTDAGQIRLGALRMKFENAQAVA